MPAFAYAEGDALAKKDAPAGRQRVTPRVDEGSQLSGVPSDSTTIAAAPSTLGFGPMSGNPLFGGGLPLKSGN